MKPLKAIGKIVSVAAPFVPIIGPVLKPLTAVTAATEMVGPPEPVATATLPSGEVVEAPVYSQAPSYDTVPAQAGSMPLPLLLGAGALALLLLGGKGRR
jgi:hypothetical protein